MQYFPVLGLHDVEQSRDCTLLREFLQEYERATRSDRMFLFHSPPINLLLHKVAITHQRIVSVLTITS